MPEDDCTGTSDVNGCERSLTLNFDDPATRSLVVFVLLLRVLGVLVLDLEELAALLAVVWPANKEFILE